jgi:hypothetical protein
VWTLVVVFGGPSLSFGPSTHEAQEPHLAFRNASRKRPLELSTWPFCIGLPWLDVCNRNLSLPAPSEEMTSGERLTVVAV